MRVYTVRPQPFGEDAVAKEIRFIVATARARGERIFAVDSRECSPYLRQATRHALAALKREGRIDFTVPAERFCAEDMRAAYLLERDPTLADEELLKTESDGITLVSL